MVSEYPIDEADKRDPELMEWLKEHTAPKEKTIRVVNLRAVRKRIEDARQERHGARIVATTLAKTFNDLKDNPQFSNGVARLEVKTAREQAWANVHEKEIIYDTMAWFANAVGIKDENGKDYT